MTKLRAIKIKVLRLAHGEGLPLPAHQTEAAAGMDLCAALPPDLPLMLSPGGRAIVPTGLTIALPHGTEAQIRPRSGLAAKFGVTVLNSPGTIDADYRGEIGVILVNHGRDDFLIRRGDRIAQMVIATVAVGWLVEVATLPGTGRGSGGFGSTGVKHAKAAPQGSGKSKTIVSKARSAKTLTRKRPAKAPSRRPGDRKRKPIST